MPEECVVVEEGLPKLTATQISLFRSEIQAKVAQYLRDRIIDSFDEQLGQEAAS